MISLPFRPIDKWPDSWKPGDYGKPSPFSGSYDSTLKLLEIELRHLGAFDRWGQVNGFGTYLQVDIPAAKFKMDGTPRADAQPNYRGVILTIDSDKFGVLTYPCNAFEGAYRQPSWQSNLRAIALGLEALRKVERYGIAERGQQYAGFAQIGSGIAMGRGMTVEEAAEFIVANSEAPNDPTLRGSLINNPVALTNVFRRAAARLHPDVGGDPDLFRKLVECRDLIEASR